MRAWNAHFPRKQLFEKYRPLIWNDKPKYKFNSFIQAMYFHKQHKPPQTVVVQSTNGAVRQDAQGIAKMMTALFARKVETMGVEDVTLKDYMGANKVAQDEQKINLDRNSQMLEFAKIFGLPEVIDPVIVGEETNAELGPAEDKGNQPKSP